MLERIRRAPLVATLLISIVVSLTVIWFIQGAVRSEEVVGVVAGIGLVGLIAWLIQRRGR